MDSKYPTRVVQSIFGVASRSLQGRSCSVKSRLLLGLQPDGVAVHIPALTGGSCCGHGRQVRGQRGEIQHRLFFSSPFLNPSSGQAVVTGVVLSPPRHVSLFLSRRVQHSHYSLVFI